MNNVLEPMKLIGYRWVDGTLIPNSVDNQSVYITTARDKVCFMYSKLIELFVYSILKPKEYFVFGMDYRVPVRYGLLQQSKVDLARLSSTVNDLGFAREYLSIWTGNSNDAWFDADAVARRRVLLKAERNYSISPLARQDFYIISIDVARSGACNSAVSVIRVHPKEDYFQANVVYIEIISSENFINVQAPRIKKLIQLYQPRDVVIDINGLMVAHLKSL